MISAFIFKTIRIKTEQLSLNGTKLINQILNGRFARVHMKLDGIKSLVMIQVKLFIIMVVVMKTEQHALHGMQIAQKIMSRSDFNILILTLDGISSTLKEENTSITMVMEIQTEH